MHFFEVTVPYILSGISVGGQYALIAIGYTMVYGILRLINFAHGDVFMVAGLLMVYIAATLPLIVAIPVVILLVILLGFVIERVAYKPLRNAPRMSVMISAIGVSYLLQNLSLYVTGGLNKNYPVIPWISDSITVLGVTTKRVTVITPFLVIAIVAVLVLLIKHTKIGIAMRAVAKDFETSQLMGIKINSVVSTTFAIGSFLAAVGSILYFSNYPGVIPTSGAMPGLKAFVAAVFGGIGSIPGAVIGGFLIGVCESLIKGMDTILGPSGFGLISAPLELATFSDAFTFILLIIILVFKPTGLFGEKATDKV
jgi:branched-chain amino acid transport system permease protein